MEPLTNMYVCEKCGKTMKENEFYTYKTGGKTELCKKCLTMHIDNFNPETFLWLLQKMDVPYIPEEWNTLRDRAYAKDPNKMNGMSVFGKYLSKMKLKQWKQYGWNDTEKIQALNEEKRKQIIVNSEHAKNELQEKYENGEISEAEYKTMTAVPIQAAAQVPGVLIGSIGANNPFNEMDFISQDDLPNPADDLTEEDKTYLAMKWGRMYKPGEWIELEKTYKEMEQSFDIQDADTINTLILICKTNLKMNQYLDSGDIEGFQKISKVSESLRKSAKFTAAQNKEEKNDFVDSIGELVSMCEREGFIPRFATDIPQDKVDLTLKDMNDYVYKLVTKDLAFGQHMEDALKKIEIQKQMNETSEKEIEEGPQELIDEDYEEFYNSVAEQKEQDKKLYYEEEN